jgi:hypothetical protein
MLTFRFQNLFAVCLAVLFFFVGSFAVSARASETAERVKNTIALGYTGPLVGYNAFYERSVSGRFAVAMEIFGHAFADGKIDGEYDFNMYFGFAPRVKFYVWDALFVDLGVGYIDLGSEDETGWLLSPGFGYRWDFGKPGGIALVPSFKMDGIAQSDQQWHYRIDLSLGWGW